MKNTNSIGYKSVMRLYRDKPDWISIVIACLVQAKQTPGGDFAGSWVLDEAKKNGIDWFPNLRTLSSYGILEKVDVVRGGRRAYYSMPDLPGVEKALQELNVID